MDHIDKAGTPKFRRTRTLPLTGTNVVDMIITTHAVFRRTDHRSKFFLVKRAPGVTANELRNITEASYEKVG